MQVHEYGQEECGTIVDCNSCQFFYAVLIGLSPKGTGEKVYKIPLATVRDFSEIKTLKCQNLINEK